MQPYERADPRSGSGDVRRAPVSLNGIEVVGENLYAVTIMANETARGPVELVRSGIDYTGYTENPVVLWIHDHSGRTAASGLPVGATKKLVETTSGEIRAWFEFLTGDPFVERIKNAWDQGFLRAASIGWRALESEPTSRGWRDTRSELLEWSLVPVPADPGALRSAYQGMMRRDSRRRRYPGRPGRSRAHRASHLRPDGNRRADPHRSKRIGAGKN